MIKESVHKETQVIKIKLSTYNRMLKLGKPYEFQDTADKLLNRIFDKLEKKQTE
jgi:hypothetical protein